MAIMENDQVCDQVIVFDDLQLVIANVFGDRIGSEINPLGELIEAFALVLRCLNDAA